MNILKRAVMCHQNLEVDNMLHSNQKINSVNSKLLAKYITKLVNSIFSDLFKYLLKKKMDIELLKDFKKLGVKLR